MGGRTEKKRKRKKQGLGEEVKEGKGIQKMRARGGGDEAGASVQ